MKTECVLSVGEEEREEGEINVHVSGSLPAWKDIVCLLPNRFNFRIVSIYKLKFVVKISLICLLSFQKTIAIVKTN